MAIYPNQNVDVFNPMSAPPEQAMAPEQPQQIMGQPQGQPESPEPLPEQETSQAPEEPEDPEFEAVLKAISAALDNPDKKKRMEIYKKAYALGLAQIPGEQSFRVSG